MTIDAYLAERRRRLPSTGSLPVHDRGPRLSISREERHDLREAAEARRRDRAQAEARGGRGVPLEPMSSPAPGSPSARRRRVCPPARGRAGTRRALGVLLLPLYVVPENLLPAGAVGRAAGYLGLLLVTALVTWGCRPLCTPRSPSLARSPRSDVPSRSPPRRCALACGSLGPHSGDRVARRGACDTVVDRCHRRRYPLTWRCAGVFGAASWSPSAPGLCPDRAARRHRSETDVSVLVRSHVQTETWPVRRRRAAASIGR